MPISSSSKSQCIPLPRPMNRQLFRSSCIAYTRRGNQSSGTERLRPSLKSTVNVSSVTVTDSAVGVVASMVKVFIPSLSKVFLVKLNQPTNPIQFGSRESSTFLQPDRLKPKLSHFILALDMHMKPLVAITCIEEKSIRACSQYSGYVA